MGTVGERLGAATAGAPWSEIARRVGLSPDAVRRQLRRRTPSPAVLAAICEALDISPDWLLTGRGPRRYSAVGAYWVRRADDADLGAEVTHRLRSSGPGTLCEIKPPGARAEPPGASRGAAEGPVLRLRRPPAG